MTKLRVNLTYFRPRGKYYTEGSYETEHKPITSIFQEVEDMMKEGHRPGLVSCPPGENSYLVLVEVPDHEHSHPFLVTEGK